MDCYFFCRYGLQRISPLLSNVAAIQEGGKIDISLAPQNLALPAEQTSIRIEPMKLVVGRGDFLSKIVNLVGLKDRYQTSLMLESQYTALSLQ